MARYFVSHVEDFAIWDTDIVACVDPVTLP